VPRRRVLQEVVPHRGRRHGGRRARVAGARVESHGVLQGDIYARFRGTAAVDVSPVGGGSVTAAELRNLDMVNGKCCFRGKKFCTPAREFLKLGHSASV
jgi:hypothetical protein